MGSNIYKRTADLPAYSTAEVFLDSTAASREQTKKTDAAQ